MPVKGFGNWTAVNATPVAGTTFTVPNLIEDSEWEFRVVAVNDAGPGKPSKSTGPHRVRDPVCERISNVAVLFAILLHTSVLFKCTANMVVVVKWGFGANIVIYN